MIDPDADDVREPLDASAAAPERVRGESTQAQPGFDAQRGIRFGANTLVVMPERDGAGGKRDGAAAKRDGSASRDADSRLEEAVGLAAAINLNVVEREIIRIRKATASTLFGKGQIERLTATVAANDIEVVVIDGALSPIQQRNLEKAFSAKVIDRTGLILEIFGERATTREGSLQVEVAHLDYQASRLVRSWTHLERQRGGVGFLGGPGESQIESDRRQIRDKIAKLKKELDEVKRTRALHRDRRQKAPYPVVALVGYTNAGKSTLFNRLTGATVMAENLLFATLDPTMRAIELPGVDKVILSDTVGFISALPTQLVAAFRATLEEVIEADLIVHVRDVAHPDSDAQAADVADVLRGLGVIDGETRVPIVTALNKLDLLDPEARAGLLANLPEDAMAISAVTGEGVDALRTLVAEMLQRSARTVDFVLGAHEGRRAAWLYAHGDVIERIDGDDGGVTLKVRLAPEMAARFATI